MTETLITIAVDHSDGSVHGVSIDMGGVKGEKFETAFAFIGKVALEAASCASAALGETDPDCDFDSLAYALMSSGALSKIVKRVSNAMHNPGADPMMDEAVANGIRLDMNKQIGNKIGDMISNAILDAIRRAVTGVPPDEPEDLPKGEQSEIPEEFDDILRKLFTPHPPAEDGGDQ